MENHLFKSSISISFGRLISMESEPLVLDPTPLNTIIINSASNLRVFSSESGIDLVLEPYTILLVKPLCSINLEFLETGEALILCFDYIGKYCDSKICKYLEEERPDFRDEYTILKMDDSLRSFAHLMLDTYSGFFQEVAFSEIKYKEFFYILCDKLPIRDFAWFLHPAMSWYDPIFRRKILDNYRKDYRAKSLADLCGLSYSSFTDKFQKEFGMHPSAWINEQMCRQIKHGLRASGASFAEIADDLKMSSVQQFSRFCRNNFGKTPSELRRELVEKDMSISGN